MILQQCKPNTNYFFIYCTLGLERPTSTVTESSRTGKSTSSKEEERGSNNNYQQNRDGHRNGEKTVNVIFLRLFTFIVKRVVALPCEIF